MLGLHVKHNDYYYYQDYCTEINADYNEQVLSMWLSNLMQKSFSVGESITDKGTDGKNEEFIESIFVQCCVQYPPQSDRYLGMNWLVEMSIRVLSILNIYFSFFFIVKQVANSS